VQSCEIHSRFCGGPFQDDCSRVMVTDLQFLPEKCDGARITDIYRKQFQSIGCPTWGQRRSVVEEGPGKHVAIFVQVSDCGGDQMGHFSVVAAALE
ncbi:unnamed protein product, partial [Prorocentrum cordatum]